MSLEIIVRRNAEVNAKKTTLLSFYLERRFSQNFHSTWQLETQKQTTANLFYSEVLVNCQISYSLFISLTCGYLHGLFAVLSQIRALMASH